MEFEIEGLDDLIKRLDLKEREMPKVISEATGKLGMLLKEKTMRETPHGKSHKNHVGGTLRRSWQLARIDAFTVVLYTNVDYAASVEFGHRVVVGKGKSKRYKMKNGSIQMVKGAYMLRTSIENMDEELGKEFEFIIENLWGK